MMTTSKDLQNIRKCTVVVFVGLVLSGLTAFPLLAELNLLTRWFVGSSARIVFTGGRTTRGIALLNPGLISAIPLG